MIEPLSTRAALMYQGAPVHDLFGMAQGEDWYNVSQSHCRRLARQYGVTERRVAGIIAALSPRQLWSSNVRHAELILQGATPGGLKANVNKAKRIAQGERPLSVLSGPKVRAFYRALTGDHSACVIDVHAANAIGISPESFNYSQASRAYQWAAETCQTNPRDLQAVVWCAQRGRGD